jgi:hypothetical protein
LDAGWPLSDATGPMRPRRVWTQAKNFIIDFVSFHLATHTVLESLAQVRTCSRKFLVNRNKLSHIYTGVNESIFNEINEEMPHELENWEGRQGYLLFRGKYNLEAGLERIVEILTDETFKGFAVICTNKLPFQIPDSSKVIVIKRHVSENEIKYLYNNAKFAISQLSKRNRLERTVPHKVFESIYFNCPIMSYKTKPILEIFRSEENFLNIPKKFKNYEIIDSLNFLFSNPEHLEKVRVNLSESIAPNFNQENLSNQFNNLAKSLIKRSSRCEN